MMADSASADILTQSLRINETFFSIQGESTWAGCPCFFVRLSGCPLRCHYCDTEYAFREGAPRSVQTILDEVRASGATVVEITGGEPLAQKRAFDLIALLCEEGFTVLIETSGAVDIRPCHPEAIRILDIKTPGSGEAARKTTELVSSASDRVQRGVALSKEVRTSLEQIIAGSTEVARAVDSIAQAQTEQLSGITQLDQGIAEISRTTQEAAGQSQQVAATARQSADEVATLRQSVERFRIAA
jgi:organic radical activating enzyme